MLMIAISIVFLDVQQFRRAKTAVSSLANLQV